MAETKPLVSDEEIETMVLEASGNPYIRALLKSNLKALRFFYERELRVEQKEAEAIRRPVFYQYYYRDYTGRNHTGNGYASFRWFDRAAIEDTERQLARKFGVAKVAITFITILENANGIGEQQGTSSFDQEDEGGVKGQPRHHV